MASGSLTGDGIEIVTHCWAKTLPQFAGFLRWQVASLLRHPCQQPVQLTVCWCGEDERTGDVLQEAGPALTDAGVRLSAIRLPAGQLWRRAIGRNIVASRTRAALVWFADVDHYFGPGCLDGLWEAYPNTQPAPAIVWPLDIAIQNTHEAGDQSWRAAASLAQVPALDSCSWTPKHYGRAIGGVQIVRGDFARLHGYLPDHKKFQQPADMPFGDFRDDVVFRNYASREGGAQGLRFSGLHRLRHTATTYQG